MKRLLTLLFAGTILLETAVKAGDLYKVDVGNATDARRLATTGVEPIARLTDGYLVLADQTTGAALASSGLTTTLVASNTAKNQMALDNRLDRANVTRHALLYEQGGFRLFRVDLAQAASLEGNTDLRPIHNENLVIDYPKSSATTGAMLAQLPALDITLDSVMSLISQDSLTSYTYHLQAYYRRAAATDSNRVARDWLMEHLRSFGYDSVVADSFTANIGGVNRICENVLAVKPGTRFPNHYLVVGAHRDGVSSSPAADDNGSGSAGVLEIARALADVPTDMTVIFALFDAEEYGLFGSYHYSDEAYARGDSIVYMLNMDMIAQYTNTIYANLYYGTQLEFTNLWIHLADSLVGITGRLTGSSSGSDHYPFTQRGYEATFVQEGDFSTVYHTFRDSTSYMNFEYMTRMVKATAATAYTVTQTAGPKPMVAFSFPSGMPSLLAPEAQDTFDVVLSTGWGGVAVPGSGQLHYSVNGDPWVTTALTEISPNNYSAILPATLCYGRVRYYVSADEETQGTFYSPDTAHPIEAVVATSASQAFEDQFETSIPGWVISSTATAGVWQRGIPNGGGDRGDPPTSFGGSGYCYMTGAADGDTDVDGGYTLLTSPMFAVNASDARVHYARWFNNSGGAAPWEDVFRVYISGNNGITWTQVDSAGPVTDAAGGWVEHSFWISQFLPPTGYMKLRFEASDLINGSLVEAAVDAVTVTTFDCVAPYICGDVNGDGVGPDIGDLSHLVDYLFFFGAEPVDMRAANVDGDAGGVVDISDLTHMVSRLFEQGPEPVCGG
jgi:hypothetical protein